VFSDLLSWLAALPKWQMFVAFWAVGVLRGLGYYVVGALVGTRLHDARWSEARAKVQALDLGADDYVTKPFGLEELLARIRSALRRSALAACEAHSGPTFQAGDLHIDFHRRVVTLCGEDVRLTPTEYELLKFMVTNANRVLTHNMLLKAVWGNRHGAEPEYLRVFVSQLRRKLRDDSSSPRYILTEPSVGYRFRAE